MPAINSKTRQMTSGTKAAGRRLSRAQRHLARREDGRRTTYSANEFDVTQSVTLQALDRRLAEIGAQHKSKE